VGEIQKNMQVRLSLMSGLLSANPLIHSAVCSNDGMYGWELSCMWFS